MTDWKAAGVTRANGEALPAPNAATRLWVPVRGGPAFLIGQNFNAVRSYNPSIQLRARDLRISATACAAKAISCKQFPGGERPPTLAELKEMQERLTKAGFDTGGTDGRDRHRTP